MTLHTFYLENWADDLIYKWSKQIKYYLELYDYECFYVIAYLHIPADKCICIANSGPANTFRDQAFLKHILGVKDRQLLFNFGLMRQDK
jgi:hypothetical protein